jgi:hypothetical protein
MNLDKLAQFLHTAYCDKRTCLSWAKDRDNARRILTSAGKAPSDTAMAYRAGYEKGQAEATRPNEAQIIDALRERVERLTVDLEIARHEADHHHQEREAVEASYQYTHRLAQAYSVRNHYLETRKPRASSEAHAGRIANNTTNEG